MTKEELGKIKALLDYLQDKVDDCYQEETKETIKTFIKSINH